jgi:hypothetical protein
MQRSFSFSIGNNSTTGIVPCHHNVHKPLFTIRHIVECARDLKGSLEKRSISERRSFIESFVKEIKIARDEAKMTCTLPMLPDGKDEDTVSVLHIERDGGPGLVKGVRRGL